MSEQRRWPRIELALDVRIQHEDLASFARAKTLDVSRGGVFLVVDRPRPKGTRVRIHLTIGAQAMVLDGIVMRVVESSDGRRPGGMGVLLVSRPAGWDELCDQVLAERRLSKVASR